jgi:hypothetical protein
MNARPGAGKAACASIAPSCAPVRAGKDEMATLLWGVLFGSIGMGFLVYGKRQSAPVPAACGIALMVFPYFVSNGWAMLLIGAALMAVPYFVRF